MSKRKTLEISPAEIKAFEARIAQADLADLREAIVAERDGLHFSLQCTCCDDGDGVRSIAEAVEAGWSSIHVDRDGLSWNFLGHCPRFNEETGYCGPSD